jgi:hypothetical protein
MRTKTLRGTLSRSPIVLPYCVSYFFFEDFFAAFFAGFLAAFLVAICLFSLSMSHRVCNTYVAVTECIEVAKCDVKKKSENFLAFGNGEVAISSSESSSAVARQEIFMGTAFEFIASDVENFERSQSRCMRTIIKQ